METIKAVIEEDTLKPKRNPHARSGDADVELILFLLSDQLMVTLPR